MQPSAVFKKSSFYKFGTNLFLVILFGSVLSAAILYSILPKELPATYTEALKVLRGLMDNLYLRTYLVYLPIAVFIIIGIFALSQSMTKKIVMPLGDIINYTKTLEGGDFSKKLTIGDSDLPPLIERLNELVEIYQSRLGSVRDAASRLESVQKNIGDYMEKDAQNRIKESVKELMEITREIDRILDKIRV